MNKGDKWIVLDKVGDEVEVVNSEAEARKLASQWARVDASHQQDSDILIAKVVMRVMTVTPAPTIKFTPVG